MKNGGVSLYLAVTVLLTAHAVLAVWAMARNSVTVDEVNHLPAGVSYVQQLTFAAYHHNPPLVKVLAALPVLASGAAVDYQRAWRYAQEKKLPVSHAGLGRDFQLANAAPAGWYQTLFFRARFVILAISMLGGWIVFCWARELHGDRAGLVALTLWTFSPNLLAHGGLVTTDTAATVAGVGATYVFWRWLRGGRRRGTVVVGLLLGVAQLVKFSSLLLFGLWPLLAIAYVFWPPRAVGQALPPDGVASAKPLKPVKLESLTYPWELARLAAQGFMIAGVCVLVINVGYLFEGTGRALGEFEFMSPKLTKPRTSGLPPYPNSPRLHELFSKRMNRFQGTLLERLPMPLPEHYLLGFDEQLFEANTGLPEGGYPMYLRGTLRRTGWWYYYFYCLAVKVPPGSWALFLGTLLAMILRPAARLALRDELCVWLPPLAMLLSMSFLTDINLGLRYVLPIFPYLMVGVSRLANRSFCAHAWKHCESKPWRCLLLAGLAANAVSTLWIAPHYLAYFNVFVGGPTQGHTHLIDSNLDWGQDLLELKHLLDRRGHTGPLPCALFGNLDPRLAGIDAALPPRDPRIVPPPQRFPDEPGQLRPGLYAISVNYAMGMPYRWVHQGKLFDSPQDAYAYFQHLTPVDRAGYSIWVYDLSPADCARLNAAFLPLLSSRHSQH